MAIPFYLLACSNDLLDFYIHWHNYNIYHCETLVIIL